MNLEIWSFELQHDNRRLCSHCDIVALIEALHLVFKNNYFKCGDTHWEQISGTGMGMGTPPAPPWATVFYGIHESQMVPRWQAHVPFYRRFIDDDVIGILLNHPDPVENACLWKEFQADMNLA
jgi:hypothetical protein